MKHIEIPDPEGRGSYSITASEDVEFVDPVEYFLDGAVSTYFFNLKGSVTFKFPSISPDSLDQPILIKATAWAEEHIKQIISTAIPKKLILLLESNSKKEKEKLLRGLSLNTDELISFICIAWTTYGFTFSEYIGEHHPKGFEGKQLPRLAHKKKDNEIKSIGTTSLSQGQIKNLIDQRSCIVSKFLDKGEKWHCFFLTFKSLNGEETGEKPHLHYISSEWGLTRNQVVEQLKSKSYKLPSLPHIDFHTYRNPKQNV